MGSFTWADGSTGSAELVEEPAAGLGVTGADRPRVRWLCRSGAAFAGGRR